MRIVRLANYVAPHSGGLRTSLRELGAGYLAAGHEPVLVIPGERDSDEQTPQGRVITLSGPRSLMQNRLLSVGLLSPHERPVQGARTAAREGPLHNATFFPGNKVAI